MIPSSVNTGTAPTHWVHDLSPFLVQFNETFGIRYYGLAYALGFLAAGWLFHRYWRTGRTTLDPNGGIDLVFTLVVGVLLGGRLGYFLFYQATTLRHDPGAILRVWEGGMSFHGGVIGVTAALWWFARRSQQSLLHLGDLVASAAPVGLLLGRIANFINGELWGKVSDVSWAVIFPHSARPGTPPILIEPRHPSQLYEAALEGLLLLAFVQWRMWRSDAVRTQPGRLCGEFLVLYAGARAFSEVFREPDASLLLGLSRGTFYSIFLVAAGGALIALARRDSKRKA